MWQQAAYEQYLPATCKGRQVLITLKFPIFNGFIEFHGDRRYADDPAIVGGIAKLNTIPVMIVQWEGHTTKSVPTVISGMPQPKDTEKALRLMKQAENLW